MIRIVVYKHHYQLMPVAMWPHTRICVLILLYMWPHTAIYVSSYWYICVLILRYICPHTAMYVSSYWYICVLALWAVPAGDMYWEHAFLFDRHRSWFRNCTPRGTLLLSLTHSLTLL